MKGKVRSLIVMYAYNFMCNFLLIKFYNKCLLLSVPMMV